MNFHKPAVEENIYVRFVYAPHTIYNHTQGQVPVSMNADPVNEIYTSQKSMKVGLC